MYKVLFEALESQRGELRSCHEGFMKEAEKLKEDPKPELILYRKPRNRAVEYASRFLAVLVSVFLSRQVE